MPLILMFHGGGKKLEDLREIKGVINLCFERGKLFTITADQDKGAKKTIKAIKEWHQYQGDREIGETIHTVRWRLYQIAAAVVRHAHQP